MSTLKDFKIITKAGIETVKGRKFSFYIDKVRYWFFYHEPGLHGHGLRISELRTGYKMIDVDYSSRAAALGNDKAACKLALAKFCAKYPQNKIRERIDSMPTLEQVKGV